MEKTNHVGDITGSVVSNVNVINGSSQSNDKKLGTVKHIGKRNNLTLGWISITLSSLSLVISVITISMHHAISLDSAWPGFVLGVLAILTTVLIGFQIKSTIDIDSKFDEQRKNLENLIAAQAEKIIVPNFKITKMIVNSQSVGDIKDSTVTGVNISGNGVRINNDRYDDLISIVKSYQRQTEEFQSQISELISIINHGKN